MHRPIVLAAAVAAALGLMAAPAAAQDAAALRQELTELQRQLDRMKTQYEQAIGNLTERLRQLEAQPRPAVAAPPPSPASPGTPPVVGQPAPGPPTVSPLDLLRPRPPFSLAERRGGGQLLFDIGVAGDFILNLTADRIARANAGTFAGRENRFFPREIELSLLGQVDPYARAEVRLEAAEEFEDGARDIHVGLAEAHLTLLTLPFATQLRLGLMRNRFGLLNPSHAHDLPQPDRPLVLQRFFGEEGLVEAGAELSWVAPLPFYLEALVGVFNGDNDSAFGRGNLRTPLVTGRLRTFLELGETGGIQLGVSAATGQTEQRLRQTILGADVKYKYTPSGWRHALLTLAGEGLVSWRRVNVLGEPDDEAVETATRRTLRRAGWYTYAELQPWLRWLGGVRYDRTQFLGEPGREWAIEPYLAFKPSEFLRFRLAWKHTEREPRDVFTGATRRADELFLQGTFILGAHPAHPF